METHKDRCYTSMRCDGHYQLDQSSRDTGTCEEFVGETPKRHREPVTRSSQHKNPVVGRSSRRSWHHHVNTSTSSPRSGIRTALGWE